MWFLSAPKSKSSCSARNAFRPRLEALEDRCLLSVSAGSLDPTFNNVGLAAGLDALVVQPDGKIVVGGAITNGGTNTWALERFNSDGSVDTTFGNNGIIIQSTGLNGIPSQVWGLAIDASNKIVARWINPPSTSSTTDLRSLRKKSTCGRH